MNVRLLTTLLVCAGLASHTCAADEEAPRPKTSMKEVLRARIAEDAKKQQTAPVAAKTEKSSTTPVAPTTPPPVGPTKSPEPAKESITAAKQQPATVLPKVEVKKGRITVLDQMLAKQDEDIAREKKNMKSSEVDLALNDSKIAKPLAIFGGDSAQFRKRVASERVELMEAEKDVMEAMARAKTKKEKDDLQKQLDELRAMRRELDKALR